MREGILSGGRVPGVRCLISQMKISALLLTAWILLGAQTPAKLTIEGTVLDSANKPLAGAVVAVGNPRGAIRATTDADGHYLLDNLDAGRYRLTPFKDGFSGKGAYIAVLQGKPAKEVTFRMEPLGVVSGRLLAEDGRPVERGIVTFGRSFYNDEGIRRLTTVAETVTDIDGHYKIPLAAGQYYVSAGPTVTMLILGGSPIQHAYYPGVTDVAKATPVNVKPGETMKLDDLRFIRGSGARIALRLVSPEGGKPSGRQTLDLFDDMIARTVTTSVQSFTRTGEDRLFFPAMPNGSYDLFLRWPTATGLLSSAFHLDVDGTAITRDLTMSPGVPLTGQVFFEEPGGKRTPAARIQVNLQPDPVGLPQTALSGTSGNLKLNSVPKGRYRIQASGGPADSYLSAALAPLNVDGPTTVEIILATTGGSVEGILSDPNGQRYKDGVIALVPDNGQAHLYRTTLSDQNGAFQLQGIAPGSYRMFAWTELPGAAYRNADFMKKYAGKGIAVKMDRGGRLAIDAKILD